MSARSTSLALALLALSASAAWAGPEQRYTWGAWLPQEKRLANGLTVQVVPRHHLPLVSAVLTTRAGVLSEGPGEAGYAALVAELQSRGTLKATGQAWAERVEKLGTRLETGAGSEGAWLQLALRSGDAKQALAWLAELAREPAFAAPELAKLRQEAEAEAQAALDDGDELAALALRQAVLAGTPLARPTSLAALRQATPARLKAFWAKHHRPESALLQLVGDVEASQAFAWAEASFGTWRGQGQAPAAQAEAPASALPQAEGAASASRVRELWLVEAPTSQAFLLWGDAAPGQRHPDHLALEAANFPLGGDFTARLTQELRDRRGLAYGSYSRFRSAGDLGWVSAGLNTRLPKAREAAEGLLAILEAYANQGPTEAEANLTRQHLQGAFPLRFESNANVADELAGTWLSGLPNAELSREGQRLGAMPRAAMAEAAKRHLRPSHGVLVAVGPSATLRPALAHLGPVRVLPRQQLIR